MATRSLFRDLKLGRTLAIVLGGERVLVSLEEKSGTAAKLRFEADEAVVIERVERSSGLPGQSGFKQALLGIKLPA